MSTRIFRQDDKLILHKRTDLAPQMKAVREARDTADMGLSAPMSDSKHVARIPKHVLEAWVKEAGLRFDDRDAVRDLIKRKLMDSDNQDFRIWGGSY